MELLEMYDFIKTSNEDFRKAMAIKDENKQKRRIVQLFRATMNETGSAFEEQCMIENYLEIARENYKAIAV